MSSRSAMLRAAPRPSPPAPLRPARLQPLRSPCGGAGGPRRSSRVLPRAAVPAAFARALGPAPDHHAVDARDRGARMAPDPGGDILERRHLQARNIVEIG